MRLTKAINVPLATDERLSTEETMDVVFIFVSLALFGATLGLIRLCERV